MKPNMETKETRTNAPEKEAVQAGKSRGSFLTLSDRFSIQESKNTSEKGTPVQYIDDNEELDFSQEQVIVRRITPQEYQEFTRYKDILPLAEAGLYERMKSKGEDARIYGGFVQGEMKIAAICRLVPAWKIFHWLEAPFGYVAEDPLDAHLLVKFIQGIEDLEDSDSLLYMRLESFLEYQQRNPDGQPIHGYNKAYRDQLIQLHMQALPLETGFQPGMQARFASVINLAEDQSLYQGGPVPENLMQYPNGVIMRSQESLLAAMDPAAARQIAAAGKPYIKVRLLARNELDLLDSLKKGSMDHEPLDLSYLDAYPDNSAVVYVALDIDKYAKEVQELYDQASEQLQRAFAAAKKHENSRKKQQALLQAMEEMKAWDQRLAHAQELVRSQKKEMGLAAGLFLFNPSETLCLWSGANPQFSWLPGLYAMHWFMLDWSCNRHAWRYTLWGLAGHFHPGEEGYESFAFNKGLGARVAEYSGAFVAAFKPGSTRAYQMYLKSRNLQ